MIEKQTERKIKRLRTDNGLEFYSGEFNQFCRHEGIQRHLTVPYTPRQNGVAERMNRTLLERARSMLSNAGLGKQFWTEAICTACHLVNRSPNASIDFKTPEEIWSDHPPSYSHLKIFDCPAFYHVSQGKLEPRAKKCIFLGYASGVKGYRLWCLDSKKLIISRDVTFDEDAILHPRKDTVVSQNSEDSSNSPHVMEVEVTPTAPVVPQPNSSSKIIPPHDDLHASDKDEEEEPPHVDESYSIAQNRPRREIRLPKRYANSNSVTYALSVGLETECMLEPSSYAEAISREDSSSWLLAMNEEMESLHKNQT